jgi:hypothetical protein
LALVKAEEGSQIRKVPVWTPPVISLAVPSEEKETCCVKAVDPRTTVLLVLGAVTAMTVSPVSTLAVVPVRVLSKKLIQPCSQFPVVAQAVPLALIHTVTRLPRRMASDRACESVPTRSLVVLLRRLDAMVERKLGMPTANKMAPMDMATKSSTKVKPRWRRGAKQKNVCVEVFTPWILHVGLPKGFGGSAKVSVLLDKRLCLFFNGLACISIPPRRDDALHPSSL